MDKILILSIEIIENEDECDYGWDYSTSMNTWKKWSTKNESISAVHESDLKVEMWRNTAISEKDSVAFVRAQCNSRRYAGQTGERVYGPARK